MAVHQMENADRHSLPRADTMKIGPKDQSTALKLQAWALSDKILRANTLGLHGANSAMANFQKKKGGSAVCFANFPHRARSFEASASPYPDPICETRKTAKRLVFSFTIPSIGVRFLLSTKVHETAENCRRYKEAQTTAMNLRDRGLTYDV